MFIKPYIIRENNDSLMESSLRDRNSKDSTNSKLSRERKTILTT